MIYYMDTHKICNQSPKTEINLLQECEVTHHIWFHCRGFNITNHQATSIIAFLSTMIKCDSCVHPVLDPTMIIEMVAFVAVTLKSMWEARNSIVHDGITKDATQIDRF